MKPVSLGMPPRDGIMQWVLKALKAIEVASYDADPRPFTKDLVRRSFGWTQAAAMLATEGDTPAAAITVTPDEDETVMVVADVVARRTGGSSGSAGDSAAYTVTALAKNIGGTLTIVNQSAAITFEDQSGWDCAFDVSGTSLRLMVTGAADNTVAWNVAGRVMTTP